MNVGISDKKWKLVSKRKESFCVNSQIPHNTIKILMGHVKLVSIAVITLLY